MISSSAYTGRQGVLLVSDDNLQERVQRLVLGLASSTHDQLSSARGAHVLPEPPSKLIDGNNGAIRTKT